MSNIVAGMARKRSVGLGPTAKAVLLYMADLASDDGTGIWASKQTMADELEMSKRALQGAIIHLQEAGFVSAVGTRKHRNGSTVEYRIEVSALENMPLTRAANAPVTTTSRSDTTTSRGAGDSPVQEVHPTRAGDAPHGVQEMHPNHPLTIHEPKKRKKIKREPISANAVISQRQVEIAAEMGFPVEEAESQFAAFKDGALANDRKYADWDAAWRNWFRSPYFTPITTGGRNDRRTQRQRDDEALREFTRRVSAGEIVRGPDPSDPFAGR